VAPALAGFGNALQYAILVDGRIVGTWQRATTRGTALIKTRFLVRLTRGEHAAVEDAACRYGDFFGLPVRVS
jgi:hypothetical protein